LANSVSADPATLIAGENTLTIKRGDVFPHLSRIELAQVR
jgi:hypothetical protein